MLPPAFRPHTVEEHKLRWPGAMVEVLDSESVKIGVSSEAAQREANLFDFQDGLRLIVSREQTLKDKQLHLIGTMLPNSELWAIVCRDQHSSRPPKLSVEAFQQLIVERFEAIVDRPIALKFMGFGFRDHTPHWTAPDPYETPPTGE